jgi:hypothetical protein
MSCGNDTGPAGVKEDMLIHPALLQLAAIGMLHRPSEPPRDDQPQPPRDPKPPAV